MIEALAYLGGAVVLVGAMLVGAQYWPDLGTAARLIIVATTAVVLFAAGLLIPARTGTVTRRLRAILWLLSTAAGSAFWALLGHESLLWAAKDTALLTGFATALYAAVLWAATPTALQQVATFAGTLITAGTAGAYLDGEAWPGIAIWVTSAAWLAAGRAGLFASKRLTQAIAAAGMVFGAMFTMPKDPAIVFALVTALGLVCAGVIWREIVVVLVGAIGLVQVLPVAVTSWFSGRAAAPLALVFGGGLLVVAAVVLARRTADKAGSDRPSIDPARYDGVVFDLDCILNDTAAAHPLIERLRAAQVDCAVISTKPDSAELLAAAGLSDTFQVRVDGVALTDLSLPGKPDPALYLLAARRLGVQSRRTVALEGTPAGIAASRAAAFGLVIGVERIGRPEELLAAGANLVVSGLDEISVPNEQVIMR
jgi:HAD superfamily hydrolase (TIGR01509 family)